MDTPSAPIPSISPQPAISSPAESSNPRWLLWLVGGFFMLIIGITLGVFGVKFLNQSTSQSQISSYEDCLTAKGSLVQESYPATCVTTSGQRFVQPLTDEEKQSLQPPDLNREPDGSAATADWKTYTNSKQNYQIEYPAEFSITEIETDRFQQKKSTIANISRDNKLPQIQIDVANKQYANREESAIKRLELSNLKIGNCQVENNFVQFFGLIGK